MSRPRYGLGEKRVEEQVPVVGQSPWFERPEPRPEARFRLFCFPHGGGGPQAYRDWARAFPPSVEVSALLLPGRGRRLEETLRRDLPRLADELARALEGQLGAPYAFFGHSVGALVAWATALRLQELGAPPPLRLFLSAHASPKRPRSGRTMYRLGDEELLSLIEELGLVPAEALADPELRQLVLPPLRADFELSESYEPPPDAAVAVPITALGGREDLLVDEAALAAWQQASSSETTTTLYPGGHFYLWDEGLSLVDDLSEQLERDLAALPFSILEGAQEDYESELCLHELFEAQAERTPDATALVDQRQELSFHELEWRTALLGRMLRARGLDTGGIVAIFMNSSAEYVISYLAILRAGGAYMPLELDYPRTLIDRVMETVEPAAVIATPEHLASLPPSCRDAETTLVLDEDFFEDLDDEGLPLLRPETGGPDPDGLAYCVMTSGTTGEPKGILCSHRGAVNSYTWRYRHLPYADDEREAVNVFFVWEVIRPILQGVPAYVIPDDVIYDPPRLVKSLESWAITRVLFTPSLLDQILNAPALDLARCLARLRMVILNGEVVSLALVQRFRKSLPHVRLINDYSISECHDVCTHSLAGLSPWVSDRFAPLGPPMANVRIYVLDEGRRPLPRGCLGEIYVGGDSVAIGYLKQPERMAERFIQDPLRRDASPLFRTGDLGRILPNGHLEVVGRTQFMIKLRGYSVVLEAVETALSEIEGVSSAVVLAVDDHATGQPSYLAAYVVGDRSRDASELEEGLRSELKRSLPPYAIPSYIVPIEQLPLNDVTGKLDRSRLPLISTIRQDGDTEPGLKTEDGMEQAVADAWCAVLDRTPTSVTDDFFDLGGHSLLAVEMCYELGQRIGRPVSVVEVYRHPVLRDLAGFLRSQALVCAAEPSKSLPEPPKPGIGPGETAIAVVGMACRFPGVKTPEELWERLCRGERLIRSFTAEELEARGVPRRVFEMPGYVRQGAVLDEVECFDPAFWGLSQQEAILTDPQQRLFLECCWEAMERAGLAPRQSGERTGVFAGCYLPSYLLHHLDAADLLAGDSPATFHVTEVGNDKDYLTTRVSHLLNLRGPSLAVQSSCSTAASAVATACLSLVAGQCDRALAGASSITFPQGGYQYMQGHVLSRDGHIRTFDAEASGTVLGDGIGVLVLERLTDARAAKHPVLAVIKGFAVNNDGSEKAGYSAPSVDGQAAVVREALVRADVPADTITYVEAHGTGTLIGDPIEVQALTEVYRRYSEQRAWCALGSIKPNIGHSNIAAGAASLIKAVLCLQGRRLPPTIDYERPNPELHLAESPFYVNDELRDWPASPDHPRRAAVSCFGIGGTNCHFILQEGSCEITSSSGADEGASAPRPVLLSLSAKTATSLDAMRLDLAAFLKAHPRLSLADAAFTLHLGREVLGERLAIAARDLDGAVSELEKRKCGDREERAPWKTTFLFPGQGAQHLGMGAGLYADFPAFRDHFDGCREIVRAELGRDLKQDVFTADRSDATRERLLLPTVLQPALFAVEYALAKMLIEWGILPAAVAGHSIGEYVAACVAGVMSLEDALGLVAVRARAIEAAAPGAMVSIRLPARACEELLSEAGLGDELDLAVINSPEETVLAGLEAAVFALEEELERRKTSFQRVRVNRPFHSRFLQEAATALAAHAADRTFKTPSIPILSNLSGGWYQGPPSSDYWARHLVGTVRFSEQLSSLLDWAPGCFIEVGPNRILSSLVKRCLRAVTGPRPRVLASLPHPQSQQTDEGLAVLHMLGRTWELGGSLHWEAFHRGEQRNRIVLPTYAFERKRCWPRPADKALGATASAKQLDCETSRRLEKEHRFFIPSWGRSLPAGPVHQPYEGLRETVLAVFSPQAGPVGALGSRIATLCRSLGLDTLCLLPPGVETGQPPEAVHRASLFSAAEVHEFFVDLKEAELWPGRVLFFVGDAAELAGSVPLQYLAWTRFCKALAAASAGRKTDVWLLGSGLARVLDERLDAGKTTLLGTSFCLPQEYPQFSCRCLDLEMASLENLERLEKAVTDELLRPEPGPDALIALRPGRHWVQRWVQRYEPISLDEARPGTAIREGGVYVVTGGLGRIGLELAGFIGGRGGTAVLADTHSFPAGRSWSELAEDEGLSSPLGQKAARLAELEVEGNRLVVHPCNMVSANSLHGLFTATIERFGRIDGIFHAAGLARLTYLPDLDEETMEDEFAPKVTGLLHLADAVDEMLAGRERQPDFVLVFSSLASILGGYGMAAYAAANRFMDTFVEARKDSATRWICVNWDDWDFAYSQEQTAAYEHTAAHFAIPPNEALWALERIISHPSAHQVLVSSRPMAGRLEQWLHHDTGAVAMGDSIPGQLEGLEEKAFEGEGRGLAERIAGIFAEVLGCDTVDVDEDFFDLGGDSLVAAQILLSVQRSIPEARELTLRSIFDCPTAGKLASRLSL